MNADMSALQHKVHELEEDVGKLSRKQTRLEHHFVTLDKQLSKQARRIEELEDGASAPGGWHPVSWPTLSNAIYAGA